MYNGTGRHCFIATKAGTALTLFADGVSVKTAVLTASDTLTQTAPAWIAAESGGAGSIAGVEDEVAIWSRALTPAEAAILWAIGTATW